MIATNHKLHDKAIVSVRYSLSGSFIATASADRTASIVSSDSGAVVQQLKEHSLGLNDCVWIDDSMLATCSDDKSVKVWDVERGASTATLTGHKGLVYCLAEDFYTRNLYTGGYDGSVIVYDPCSRSALCTISAHSESITSMACSMIGTDLATGSYDGLIRIWDNRSMSCCKFTLANAKNVSVSSTRFSENGRYLLASFMDNTHILYDMIHQTTVFSSNSNSNSNSNSSSSHFDVVDPIYGAYTLPPRPIKCYTGHQNSRYSIFSDFYQCIYGKYIISGSEDGKIYVWNLGNRQIAHSLSGHEGTVFAVAGQPNPDLPPKIVSGGEDGCLNIWDMNLLNSRNSIIESNGNSNSISISNSSNISISNNSNNSEVEMISGGDAANDDAIRANFQNSQQIQQGNSIAGGGSVNGNGKDAGTSMDEYSHSLPISTSLSPSSSDGQNLMQPQHSTIAMNEDSMES